MELTAPVDVPVVDAANRAEAASPKRVSLPSMAPPASWGAVPGAAISAQVSSPIAIDSSSAITPPMAMPWRRSLTIRPNAHAIANGITSTR